MPLPRNADELLRDIDAILDTHLHVDQFDDAAAERLDHSLPLHSGYTFRTRAIVTAQMARGLEVACLTGVRQGAAGADPETIENIPFYRTPAPAAAPRLPDSPAI